MKTTFVDSNLFLRYLTRDDPEQSERAGRLFREAAAGMVRLVTGPPVFFEVAWALQRRYKVSHPAILAALRSVLAYPNLTATDEPIAARALTLAEKRGMTYADAYIAAIAEFVNADELATFNRKHFEGIIDLHALD